MSVEGQNVYPVDKVFAWLTTFILRYFGALRQHLVVRATHCGEGNTTQAVDGLCYNAFT